MSYFLLVCLRFVALLIFSFSLIFAHFDAATHVHEKEKVVKEFETKIDAEKKKKADKISKIIKSFFSGKQRDGLLYDKIKVRTGLSFGLSFGYSADYFKLGEQISPVAGLIAKIKNRESLTASGVLLDLSGLADGSSGESNTNLTGFDANLVIQYEIPHTPLFVRTGFSYGHIIPIRFAALGNILIPEISTVEIPLDIDLDYKGYQLEVPLVIGLNLLKNEFSNIYIAFGLNWSYLSLRYGYGSRSRIDLGHVQPIYYSNSEKGSTIGLLTIIGGSVKVYKHLDLFADFKYFVAAATVNINRPDDQGLFVGVVAGILLPEIATFRATGALLPYPAGGFDRVEGQFVNGEAFIRELSYLRFNIGIRFHL